MLLYSVMLDIDASLTPDKFIELVIRWNKESPYEENIIHNMEWNGERNIRFEDTYASLELREYEKKNILAARYEKTANDGAIWDTEYIMNFDEIKMCVRLDRTYSEDALLNSYRFSTPHFVSMLMKEGYVKTDDGLPTCNEPIVITKRNASLIADVINGKKKYKLPIVYVTKTRMNESPLNVSLLCSHLKGAAHVLVNENNAVQFTLQRLCEGTNEYDGAVGIYYPNSDTRRMLYNSYSRNGEGMMNRITKDVFRYVNSQVTPSLYTWQGVAGAVLQDELDVKIKQIDKVLKEKSDSENENDALLDSCDADLERYKNQIADLNSRIEKLTAENMGLRQKYAERNEEPILFAGQEKDLYDDEIKEILLSILEEAGKNSLPKSRRADVIADILSNNDYKGTVRAKKKDIQNILSTYTKMNSDIRSRLQKFGFEISEEGKHYKLTYYGDDRYMNTISKTGSDWRVGKNNAQQIIKSML